MINPMLSPTWGGNTTDYGTRNEVMNDAYQARTELESKAQNDYYAAKKQSEIQSSMFGGTALANTPNLNTDSGQRTSTAKALTTFGLTLLTGGLAGVPVGVAAAMGLNQAAKGYGRDMNRSYRLNKALSGDLDQYTDLSIQDWVMSGDSSKLKLLEEENSQIRKFNERPEREQYVGSKEVFENITGLEATTANGWQGAGMYSQKWDSFANKYSPYAKSGDTRQTEEAIRKSRENPTGKDAKSFAGKGEQFVDANGNTQTLYRKDDGRFYDASSNPVDVVGQGLKPVNQTNIDIARKLMTDPDATQSQREWAANILNIEGIEQRKRGDLSQSQYETQTAELYQLTEDAKYMQSLLDMAKEANESGYSLKGAEARTLVNSYLEPFGVYVGDEEANQLMAALRTGDYEYILMQAPFLKPFSDANAKLLEDNISGGSMTEKIAALEGVQTTMLGRIRARENILKNAGATYDGMGELTTSQPTEVQDDPLGIR